ncbi:hypothetical protein [Sphingomonas sp. F9_3S_D5_B_2]
MHLTGVARRDDGRSFRVLVTDLGYEGCKLFCEEPLDKGEVVSLVVAGMGNIDAQVRWAAHDRAGLSFLLGQSVHEARRSRLGI